MARKKKPQEPGWKDIEKIVSQFDNRQLMELVHDLYRLSQENKDFFFTRFSIEEDPLPKYKKIIQNSIHPYIENDEELNIKEATEAVNRYSNAVNNPLGEAEIKVFYVECGNNFTLSYGDIDEDFYDELVAMYESAIKSVLQLPPKDRDVFKARLQKVMESASGIGWGYHDGLCESYYKAFPET